MNRRDRRTEKALVLEAIAIVAMVALCAPAAAHAYIDPGSGALIWQMLIAAFFGGMFYFRRGIGQIKSWFGGKPKEPEQVPAPRKSED